MLSSTKLIKDLAKEFEIERSGDKLVVPLANGLKLTLNEPTDAHLSGAMIALPFMPDQSDRTFLSLVLAASSRYTFEQMSNSFSAKDEPVLKAALSLFPDLSKRIDAIAARAAN